MECFGVRFSCAVLVAFCVGSSFLPAAKATTTTAAPQPTTTVNDQHTTSSNNTTTQPSTPTSLRTSSQQQTSTPTLSPSSPLNPHNGDDGGNKGLGRGIGIGIAITLSVVAVVVAGGVWLLWKRRWILPCRVDEDGDKPLNISTNYHRQSTDDGGAAATTTTTGSATTDTSGDTGNNYDGLEQQQQSSGSESRHYEGLRIPSGVKTADATTKPSPKSSPSVALAQKGKKAGSKTPPPPRPPQTHTGGGGGEEKEMESQGFYMNWGGIEPSPATERPESGHVEAYHQGLEHSSSTAPKNDDLLTAPEDLYMVMDEESRDDERVYENTADLR